MTGVLGGLGSLFGGGTTPEEQQRAAIFQAGLAALANAQQPGATFGGSLFSGFQAGAGALQQAQQNAFQSKRLKQQEEREARLEEQQNARIKLDQDAAALKARERGASVAQRVSTGIGNAKGRELEYFNLVRNTPEFADLAAQYDLDPGSITTPQQVLQLQQQLGSVGGLLNDPPSQAPLELKAIVGPGGKPRYVSESEALGQQPYYQPPASTNINVNQPGESERNAATLGVILEGGMRDLDEIRQVDPAALVPTIQERAIGSFSETGANLVRSPLRQQAESIQADVVDASLALTTGAAYTREQLIAKRKAYIPQIGDDPKTVELKDRRFRTLVQAARVKAGRAAGGIDTALSPPSDGAAVPIQGQGGRLQPNADGSYTYTPTVP